MEKVRELLTKMDIEIAAKVAEKTVEKEEDIKAYAQLKYDEAYAEKVAEIEAEAGKEYVMARKYLEELLIEEPIVEEVVETLLTDDGLEELAKGIVTDIQPSGQEVL